MSLNRIIFSYVFFCFLNLPSPGFAQQIKLVHSGTGISLRGLSVVSDDVVWVSGNKGTVGVSYDGGNAWHWMKVLGFEDRDFRDIEAFDRQTAIIMAVGEPAVIIKTTDGGKRWKVVYRNETKGMFLDAMEFWNEQSGIVLGDPVNGRFFIARTFDAGFNWRAITPEKSPQAGEGEACFAASGTNVKALARDEACFISGGTRSRFFWKNEPVVLPLVQGGESTGGNSIAVWLRGRKRTQLVVVGGDFYRDTARDGNCAVSNNGGRTWKAPKIPPTGYRSCVEFLTRRTLVTCGLNGVDVSNDGGETWSNISKMGFHVCRKAKKGKKVFLAGADGRVGTLTSGVSRFKTKFAQISPHDLIKN